VSPRFGVVLTWSEDCFIGSLKSTTIAEALATFGAEESGMVLTIVG